jgi:hypothetical protein
LWYIDAIFPYKNSEVCELIRWAVIWIIWKERNKLIFKGGYCKSIRAIESSINSLAKYWSLRKNDEFQTKLYLILPLDIQLLPVQVLGSPSGLVPVEDED